MKTIGFAVGCALLTALIAPAMIRSAPVVEQEFTLAAVIPDDVFLFEAQRSNPERDFIDGYWGEVLDALSHSGVSEDLVELFGGLLTVEQTAEVGRLKARVSELIGGVDWEALEGKESVFAERFDVPFRIGGGGPPILMPDMVMLFRGTPEGAAKNYNGLVAILEGILEEVSHATGMVAMTVEKDSRMGAKVASVNVTAMAPGAPPYVISLAHHEDTVVIGMRKGLFDDTLALLTGSGDKQPLAKNRRFKAAFAELPPAEDSMSFFDMQSMTKMLRTLFDGVVGMTAGAHDVTRNGGMSEEAGEINRRALAAYAKGDATDALALTQKAHSLSPDSSTLLYNLACFNALVGNKDRALDRLEEAVEGGFYAPSKIASDRDLDSLRGEREYKAILAKATTLAASSSAEDIAVNSENSGEVYRLRMQAGQAYEQEDYERGLELTEQAYALAPKDSQVLYMLGCFHKLLGHNGKAFDYLARAVDGGYYCPRHISSDPDWDDAHDDKRFNAALAKAKVKAGEMAQAKKGEKVAMIARVLDRVMDSVAILDYTAAVGTTDGYSTTTETIAALVPDAKERAIYPVIGGSQQTMVFDRFLPKETLSYSINASGVDLGKLYTFLEDTASVAGEQGKELWATWNAIQKQIGFDIHEDLIDWFDGDSINVTLENGAGSVSFIKVTDEEAAREKVGGLLKYVTTKLPGLIREAAQKNQAFAGLGMMAMGLRLSPVEHESLDGFENIHLPMTPQPAVWGVADGHLIFGSSADAVALCLATAKGDHPNIRKNARVMREAIVPSGRFVVSSLSDLRGTGTDIAAALAGGAMGVGMVGAMVPMEPQFKPLVAKVSSILGKLAPLARKIDFYKSSAVEMTFDGRKWRTRSVTHYVPPSQREADDID